MDKARKNLSDITGKIGDCREVHGKLSNGEVSDKCLIDELGIDTDGLNCTCNGGKNGIAGTIGKYFFVSIQRLL